MRGMAKAMAMAMGSRKSYSVFSSKSGNLLSEINLFWPFHSRLNFLIMCSGYSHNNLRLTFILCIICIVGLFFSALNYKLYSGRGRIYLVHCNIQGWICAQERYNKLPLLANLEALYKQKAKTKTKL